MKWPIIIGIIVFVLFVIGSVPKLKMLVARNPAEVAAEQAAEAQAKEKSATLERRNIIRAPDKNSVVESPSSQLDNPPIPAEDIPVIVSPPKGLEDSDSQVQKAVEDLAVKMLAWLPSDALDKSVLFVDLLADGEVPNKHRPIEFPMAPFKVNSLSVADVTNYQRATPVIDVLIGISPQRLAQYYQAWRPVLEKSYRGLGKTGVFDQRLHKAIDRIIAVQPLARSASLKRPSVMYKYADKSLEAAPALDKLMWRLGVENMSRVQRYMRELKSLL